MKNDKTHGFGKKIRLDGCYWEGEFSNGEFNGEIKAYRADGF